MNRSLTCMAAIIVLAANGVVLAEDVGEDAPRHVLLKNVRVWDGTSDALTESTSVLVEENIVKKIGAAEHHVRKDATEVDCGGRVLMPGLHEQHVHFSIYNPLNTGQRLNMDPFHVGAVGILRAERMLMNGYTTAHDMAGPAVHIKKVVDAGLSPGPRVFASEAGLTQTSGHVDFRNLNDPHPNSANVGFFNWMDRYVGVIADGDTEIRRAVRENLRRGATQIKYVGTGGVASPSDPLHSVQYTPHEIRVMVEAASDWDTYVAAHVFNEEGIMRAIDNGVKSLEHVPFLTDAAAKKMIENDIMFATAVAPVLAVEVEQAREMYNPESFAKWNLVRKGAVNMLEVIERNPKLLNLMTLGTDLVNQWERTLEQDMRMNEEFTYLSKYFTPVQILRIATSNGARMNMMTGKNHPYQEGPLGVIVEGAYADMILVDGNPLEDVTLLADPNRNLKLIMKDGVIYKNTLLHEMVTREQRRKIREVLPAMYGDYNSPQ